jgi:hypothetical protein
MMMKVGDEVVCISKNLHDGTEGVMYGEVLTIVMTIPGTKKIPMTIMLEGHDDSVYNSEMFRLVRTMRVFERKIKPLLAGIHLGKHEL